MSNLSLEPRPLLRPSPLVSASLVIRQQRTRGGRPLLVCWAHLGHLLLALGLSGLGVGVVVRLDQDKVVGLRVDHKLAGRVLQGEGHLVEDRAQFLQSQNPEGTRGDGKSQRKERGRGGEMRGGKREKQGKYRLGGKKEKGRELRLERLMVACNKHFVIIMTSTKTTAALAFLSSNKHSHVQGNYSNNSIADGLNMITCVSPLISRMLTLADRASHIPTLAHFFASQNHFGGLFQYYWVFSIMN